MSDLNRIKQAMTDGEHTDGDLEWCVDEIERLQARVEAIDAHVDIAMELLSATEQVDTPQYPWEHGEDCPVYRQCTGECTCATEQGESDG